MCTQRSHTCARVHIHDHTHMCTQCSHACMHMCTHMLTHMHTDVCTQCSHTCTHVHIHAHTHVLKSRVHNTLTHAHAHKCTHTHTRMHTHMHPRTHTGMRSHIHVLTLSLMASKMLPESSQGRWNVDGPGQTTQFFHVYTELAILGRGGLFQQRSWALTAAHDSCVEFQETHKGEGRTEKEGPGLSKGVKAQEHPLLRL